MKKILIIGANGFVGRKLCATLSERNKVTALDIEFDEDLVCNQEIEKIKRDCTKYDMSDLIKREYDALYFLMCTSIPKEGTENVEDEITSNLIPLIRILNLIIQFSSHTRLIFVSSGGTVYGDTNLANKVSDYHLEPICSYGSLKLVQEEYIKLYGRIHDLDYIIARVSNIYGSGQKKDRKQGIIPILIKKIQSNENIEIWGGGGGNRKRLYILK